MNHQNPMKEVLWQPNAQQLASSQLHRFMKWLEDSGMGSFEHYDTLWEWSVTDPTAFWVSVWDYFDIDAHPSYDIPLSEDPMPKTKWFSGSELNYAAHIFRNKHLPHPAIIATNEKGETTTISWNTLTEQVAAMAFWMRQKGIQKGDRVVGYLPNIPEATIAFLAACAIGAIWSSCSPDFGTDSVVERFTQIKPKMMVAVSGYQYGGKWFDKKAVIQDIVHQLPTLEQVVLVDDQLQEYPLLDVEQVSWDAILALPHEPLQFTKVPFDHPIWVLYSSGTTGIPKAITHSHGGVLLEHLKYLAFHNDVGVGDRFFWYTTTGWMMWNFVQGALLLGATIVLYDGSPSYPNLEALWQLAALQQIDHFGTSAPFLIACMKRGKQPGTAYDLEGIRSISSTGAPLPPEAYDWVYEAIGKDVWLCSMSGGTDVCTAFVGGVPTLPVIRGKIQRRALGVALYAYNDDGIPVYDQLGEMVITKSMPSMPIYFWNDPGGKRYRSSYFEHYPGVWRHGDWVNIDQNNYLEIFGRSDATLNRHGIRIGTAEIYRALNQIPELEDGLIVNLELPNGGHLMPLFVKMKDNLPLTTTIKNRIKTTLRQQYSPRHVPDEIIQVEDIPYTISGKKLEQPVKRLLMGMDIDLAANKGAMRNPESLAFFIAYRKQKFE